MAVLSQRVGEEADLPTELIGFFEAVAAMRYPDLAHAWAVGA